MFQKAVPGRRSNLCGLFLQGIHCRLPILVIHAAVFTSSYTLVKRVNDLLHARNIFMLAKLVAYR